MIKEKLKSLIKRNIFSDSSLKYDRVFLFAVMLLSLYGTFMVFSAGYAYADFRYGDAYYFIKRQVVWLAIGVIAMLVFAKIDTTVFFNLTSAAYIATLLLLGLTLIIGVVGNGAQRWISIGPITIQPSEICKLTMTMMLARYFAMNEKSIAPKNKLSVFINDTAIPCVLMAIPILLVMLQHHLSCIIILGVIGLLVIVISGVNLKYIGAFVAGGALGVSYIALFTDYTKDRITVWQDPESYKLTGGWQTLQGLMAIGSGGLFGKGYGNGELKYCYVSEPANDMIFAILCEELGFVGASVAILLFGFLIYRGFMIALGAKNTYSRLLGTGIMVKIAVQTLLNIAVVTNTIPNTGISLPFFSYGGSSLIMIFMEMGIMLSISKESTFKRR